MIGRLDLKLPCLIGVVHLAPLPGAPRYGGSLEQVLERALSDARALREGGCHAIVVENMGDVPFHAEAVPPETVAAMSLGLRAVMDSAPDLPVGVNVLRNDARSALGLCAATGASFVRVNVHTGAAVTDQGLIQGRAADTLRERARLCPGVTLMADVHVKHATPLGDESIADAADEALGRGMADAVILTGKATGSPPDPRDLQAVRNGCPGNRVLIGSGLTPQNARELLANADGAIVGTWLKAEGRIENGVDAERVRVLRECFDAGRG